MNVPMHRFKYTKLTKDQVDQKLAATAAGPKSTSEFSDTLAGKSLKIVTDNGPVLKYTFRSKNRLTLAEGEGSAVESAYGALTLEPLVLFSHMVPKTEKGYNVVVDLKTNLATVFEVWFCGGKDGNTVLDDREVQRQIYFGYVEVAGQKPPEQRHHLTNRMEGKGLYWKQDNGIETLELFTSVVSSNFVELTRHADDLGYCAPSDYVLVNDNTYIYQRTECEFSGISTLYVADLYSATQAGARLGFNEKDELEYYMFRGTGNVVGQLAYLEPFNEHGKAGMAVQAKTAQAKTAPQAPRKGQRMTYRPVRTFQYMSDEQVHQVALKNTTAFGGGAVAPQAQAQAQSNNIPFTDMLVGKEFTLRYDNGGPVWQYKFTEKFKLKYKEEKETQWHEEPYRAYEADEKLVWFAHILTDSKPRSSVAIAVDLLNGLTTCIYSHMGTQYYGNETTYRAIFGVAEGAGFEAPVYMRHQFTDELVGHAFSWSYSDSMTSMHVYTSPHSMTWTIFTDNQTMGAHWGSPCLFVKLRDEVYIFCQNEEACNGAEMIELINTKISHDCGFNYSGGARGVTLGITGAIGRHIGYFDIKKYYGPKVHKMLQPQGKKGA